MNDTADFGSFTHSFLTSFRDEYVKLPCITFPFLSHRSPQQGDALDTQAMVSLIDDALYLRSLYELSEMTTPIQSPSSWASSAWGSGVRPECKNSYHTSAIISGHIETITLPLRLRRTQEDLASFSGQLNWRGNTPFSHLEGVFPVSTALDVDRGLYDFTAGRLNQKPTSLQFSRRDVTRGLSSVNFSAYNRWSSDPSIQNLFVSRARAPAYPIPTSFPPFFQSSTDDQNQQNQTADSEPSFKPHTVEVLSSANTSAASADLFANYAKLADSSWKRADIINAVGLDRDELKDLANDLWTLGDNFVVGDGS